jgi:hypothetical protein
MDSEHVLEQLDAYALGAVEEDEAKVIEEHIAECVGCWNELGRAQETAALLTLSVPLHQAPERLGQRIISTAQRETSPIRAEEKRGFFQRIGMGWPALAGTFGVATVAAFAFGLSMQQQVSDLEGENSALSADLRASTFALEQELASTKSQVETQEILFEVSNDEDAQQFDVMPVASTGPRSDPGVARYTYSASESQGVVECTGLDPLPPGMLYELWVVNDDGTHPVATFQPQDGECLVTMKLGYLESPPTGIGVTTETIPGGLDEPDGDWILYSEIPQE